MDSSKQWASPNHRFRLRNSNRTACVVVVDVLGRYSIEWVPNWPRTRWAYRMSFMDDEQTPTPMTFYAGDELGGLIRESAQVAGCQLAAVDTYDRSIMVGRHTTTCDFNRRCRPYRTFVNSLIDPTRTTDLSELIFDVEIGSAPRKIVAFFELFSGWWNEILHEAIAFTEGRSHHSSCLLPSGLRGLTLELKRRRAASPRQYREAVLEPTLAQFLRRLEVSAQQGLGVGHSLIAVAYVNEGGG